MDHLNARHARARCTDCGATAIAFQIVLVSGSPDPVVPRNEAVAINENARAASWPPRRGSSSASSTEPVRFTGAGRAELADVRRELRALEAQDLPPAELHAAVEAQEARVRTTCSTDELVPKADPDDGARACSTRELLQDTDARLIGRQMAIAPHVTPPPPGGGRSSRSPTASS